MVDAGIAWVHGTARKDHLLNMQGVSAFRRIDNQALMRPEARGHLAKSSSDIAANSQPPNMVTL